MTNKKQPTKKRGRKSVKDSENKKELTQDDITKTNINNDSNSNDVSSSLLHTITHHVSFLPVINSSSYNSRTSTYNSNMNYNHHDSNICAPPNVAFPLHNRSQYIKCFNKLFHPRSFTKSILNKRNPYSLPPDNSTASISNRIHAPKWTTLPNYPIFHHPKQKLGDDIHDANHQNDDSQTKPILDDAIPIIRHATCMDTSPCNQYLAIGTTSGHVEIYSLKPMIRPITRIQTTASQRYISSIELNPSIVPDYTTNPTPTAIPHTDTTTISNNKSYRRKARKSSNTNHHPHNRNNDNGFGNCHIIQYNSVDRVNIIECLSFGHHRDQNLLLYIATNFEIECRDLVTQDCVWYLSLVDGLLQKNSVYQWSSIGFENQSNDHYCYYNNSNNGHLNTNISGEGEIMKMNGQHDIKNSFVNSNKELIHNRGKKLVRGSPTRFHVSDDGQILISFSFSSESASKIENDGEETNLNEQSQAIKLCKNERLDSPILMIYSSKDTLPEQSVDDKNMSSSRSFAYISGLLPKDKESSHHPVVGFRAVAIWDKSDSNRIIASYLVNRQRNSQVEESDTQSSNSTDEITQELMLIDKADQSIIARTVLCVKPTITKGAPNEAINQSEQGAYTIATAARGAIKLFFTEGLRHLATYGEGVSIHNHSMTWQDCFIYTGNDVRGKAIQANKSVVANPSSSLLSNEVNHDDEEKWGAVIERPDEVRHRVHLQDYKRRIEDQTSPREKESLRGLHIISIPNSSRGPVELMGAIHFWDLSTAEFDGGSKLPSFTLEAPARSRGIVSLLHTDPVCSSYDGKFIVSTRSGDCQVLEPVLASDWAGKMYPSNYCVIDDNITYIEDEDEIDQVVEATESEDVIAGNEAHVESTLESNLDLAMKISAIDDIIDICDIGDNESSKQHTMSIPCHPDTESYLKKKVSPVKEQTPLYNANQNYNNNAYSNTNEFIMMNNFPQNLGVGDYVDREQSEYEKRIKRFEDDQPATTISMKNRRIEVMMNSSVDKMLTKKLAQLGQFARGDGSRLRIDTMSHSNTLSTEVTKKSCTACLGRLTVHSCGKRSIPTDPSIAAKEEELRIENERKEKERIQEERRKKINEKRAQKKLKLEKEMEVDDKNKSTEGQSLQNYAEENVTNTFTSSNGDEAVNTEKVLSVNGTHPSVDVNEAPHDIQNSACIEMNTDMMCVMVSNNVDKVVSSNLSENINSEKLLEATVAQSSGQEAPRDFQNSAGINTSVKIDCLSVSHPIVEHSVIPQVSVEESEERTLWL